MAGKRKSFRLIDHTGDLGMEVWGEDLPQLFAHAAQAFFEILVETKDVRPVVSRTVIVEAPDREGLLVVWLGELLFLFEARRMVFSRYEIRELTDSTLRALVWGERFDPDRHRFRQGIKAVTYHQLRVWEAPPGWRARVILDI